MARQRWYQIKEVAEVAGVSVRALHHYDEIGLLVPSKRTDAGYRLYDAQDLLRLQSILLGRGLGLALEEIRRLLDDPSCDRKRLLVAQRAELQRRARHTAAMLRAVDRAIAQLEGDTMDPKDLFEGFEPSEHEAEVAQRWGNSEAYRESGRRTALYTREDWQRFAVEQGRIYADLQQALVSGKTPGDVGEAAERHRLGIERWFYPCSHEQHRRLADLYEQDPRFAENIDKHGPGLTPFLAAAIRENARRHGA